MQCISEMHPAQVVRPEFLHRMTHADLEKVDVEVGKHLPQRDFSDVFAWRTVKGLRMIADVVFYKRYVHRAIVLETVAAIPGMVGGLIRHLKSLRKMEDDTNIRVLLAEAENERMHLMTWMEVAKPLLLERLIVMALQGVFFNAYLMLYIVSAKTAHRLVGYLEEEAIISYTEMVREIQAGIIPNTPAPEIAKKYWNLGEDATLLDVTLAIRADEATHRDTNHEIADVLEGIE
ncbi:ubiquinol oxidase [Nematocida ausubeli]|uniref:Alternative oxidase n=1 Tax=Nematocida ausubeli (strain ATCC PRA-371 / ERTm2) TaxID=1913371 RepID=H8ZG25_NEMA1|nr:alternative oxidase superfamily protein [Nematocida ausubeli]KAI5136355.1 ubiquinol oxidase [Nematocida ausubeli]KAI5149574.1 ubiquinol oxidase [Nematocida ausubeli]